MSAAFENLRWGYRPSASSSVFDCRPPVADKGHSAVVRLPLARLRRGALSLHAGQEIPVFREGEMARRRGSFDNKNLRAVTVKALTRFFGSALACGQMIGAAVMVTPEVKGFGPRSAGDGIPPGTARSNRVKSGGGSDGGHSLTASKPDRYISQRETGQPGTDASMVRLGFDKRIRVWKISRRAVATQRPRGSRPCPAPHCLNPCAGLWSVAGFAHAGRPLFHQGSLVQPGISSCTSMRARGDAGLSSFMRSLFCLRTATKKAALVVAGCAKLCSVVRARVPSNTIEYQASFQKPSCSRQFRRPRAAFFVFRLSKVGDF